MGMDLYSKRKPRLKDNLYYRFNWYGWRKVCDFLDGLGCDLSEFSGSNDGELVSPETCEDVANKIDEVAGKVKHLLACDPKELPLHIADEPLSLDGTDCVKEIVARRLKGETVTPSCDDNANWDDPLTRLAYYIGFGDFCRRCAKLGGFVQW